MGKYEWPCDWRIADLDWKCHVDSPSFLGEFTWAFSLKVGKEELMILALWLVCGLAVEHLEGKYRKKSLLNAEEAKEIDEFILLEQATSGNHFAIVNFNCPTSREQILGMLDVIQWSYNEVDAYNKHMQDMQPYLIKIFCINSLGPIEIITQYLDYLDDIRTQAAAYGNTLPHGVVTLHNSSAWKKTLTPISFELSLVRGMSKTF